MDKGAVVGDVVVTAGVSGVYRKIKNKECQRMDIQRKKTRRATLTWAVIRVITRCRSQEASKAINNNQRATVTILTLCTTVNFTSDHQYRRGVTMVSMMRINHKCIEFMHNMVHSLCLSLFLCLSLSVLL